VRPLQGRESKVTLSGGVAPGYYLGPLQGVKNCVVGRHDAPLARTICMLALRPEFLPIMGSRNAVNAQNDSIEMFFRSLFSPAVARPS
jgi:hypothetical protein